MVIKKINATKILTQTSYTSTKIQYKPHDNQTLLL